LTCQSSTRSRSGPSVRANELALGVVRDLDQALPYARRGLAEGGDDRGAIGVVDEGDTVCDDVVWHAAVVLAEFLRNTAAVAEGHGARGTNRWQEYGGVLDVNECRATSRIGA
jgi:hypothetical protein